MIWLHNLLGARNVKRNKVVSSQICRSQKYYLAHHEMLSIYHWSSVVIHFMSVYMWYCMKTELKTIGNQFSS